jgi:hypothetical protein
MKVHFWGKWPVVWRISVFFSCIVKNTDDIGVHLLVLCAWTRGFAIFDGVSVRCPSSMFHNLDLLYLDSRVFRTKIHLDICKSRQSWVKNYEIDGVIKIKRRKKNQEEEETHFTERLFLHEISVVIWDPHPRVVARNTKGTASFSHDLVTWFVTLLETPSQWNLDRSRSIGVVSDLIELTSVIVLFFDTHTVSTQIWIRKFL